MTFKTLIGRLIWGVLERRWAASRGLADEFAAAAHPFRKTMGPSCGWGAAAGEPRELQRPRTKTREAVSLRLTMQLDPSFAT